MKVLDLRFYRGTCRDFSGFDNDMTPYGVGVEFRRAGDVDILEQQNTARLGLISNDDSINISTVITLIVFEDHSVHAQFSGNKYIICKNATGAFDYALYSSNYNRLRFRSAGVAPYVTTDLNGKQCFAVTLVAGGAPKFYIDGVFIGQPASSNPLPAEGNNLYIGGQANAGYGPLGTQFRAVQIWDEELSPEQISHIYHEIKGVVSPKVNKRSFCIPSAITGRENNLVGAWNMENTKGDVYDAGPNAHHGEVHGCGDYTSDLDGRKILNFDGVGNYVDVDNLTELDSTQHLTLVVWAKVSTTAGNYPLFTKTQLPTSSSYRLGIHHYVGVGTSFLMANGANTYGSCSDPPAGKWHQYAMVFDGAGADNPARLKGYIDGQEQTLSFTGTIPSSTAVLHTTSIGRFDAGDDVFCNGQIAEVKVFSHSMSPEEIRSDYLKLARLPVFEDDFSDAFVGLDDYQDQGYITNTEWLIGGGRWKLGDVSELFPGAKAMVHRGQSPAYVERRADQAYGTWEFDMKTLGPSYFFPVVGPTGSYSLRVYASGEVRFYYASSRRWATSSAYATLGEWYRFRITRDFDNWWTVYIKGGAYKTWTLIPTDSGVNPTQHGTETVCSSTRLMTYTGVPNSAFRNLVYMRGVVVP